MKYGIVKRRLYSQVSTEVNVIPLVKVVLLFAKQDVLNNETLKLDWMFQMSFASDVAKVRGGRGRGREREGERGEGG